MAWSYLVAAHSNDCDVHLPDDVPGQRPRLCVPSQGDSVKAAVDVDCGRPCACLDHATKQRRDGSTLEWDILCYFIHGFWDLIALHGTPLLNALS